MWTVLSYSSPCVLHHILNSILKYHNKFLKSFKRLLLWDMRNVYRCWHTLPSNSKQLWVVLGHLLNLISVHYNKVWYACLNRLNSFKRLPKWYYACSISLQAVVLICKICSLLINNNSKYVACMLLILMVHKYAIWLGSSNLFRVSHNGYFHNLLTFYLLHVSVWLITGKFSRYVIKSC